MLVLNHEAYSFYHRIISIVAFNQANIVYWIVGYFKFQTILSTVSKIVTFLNLTGRQQWRNWRNTHVILPKVLVVPGFSTTSASSCSYFIFSYPDHKIEAWICHDFYYFRYTSTTDLIGNQFGQHWFIQKEKNQHGAITENKIAIPFS